MSIMESMRRLNEIAYKSNEKEKEFEKVEMDLLTENYTSLFREKEFEYNAPHTFLVTRADTNNNETGSDTDDQVLAEIHFQEGPIKECGVNGVNNEDLICMVLDRLQHFQQSEYSCRENACAITKLEEALMWLRKRTNARAKRGVVETSTV